MRTAPKKVHLRGRSHLGAVSLGANLHDLCHSWENKRNTEEPGIANGTPSFLSHIKGKNKGNEFVDTTWRQRIGLEELEQMAGEIWTKNIRKLS